MVIKANGATTITTIITPTTKAIVHKGATIVKFGDLGQLAKYAGNPTILH